MSAELRVDQAVRIKRGPYTDRIGRVVRFQLPLVAVRIPRVGLRYFDELDVEPPAGAYATVAPMDAARASVAEPEGYDDHLDSIELRVVRLPRKVAPPINIRLDGITAFGRVAGRGIAAFVPKGGA